MIPLAVFHGLTTRQALLYAQAQRHIGAFNFACLRPLVPKVTRQALEKKALSSLEVFKESLIKR